LPCLVVPDPRVELPPDIVSRRGLTTTVAGETVDSEMLAAAATAFAEDWTTPARSPYVFYATDFEREGHSLRGLVKDLVGAITTPFRASWEST
jgi:hypothetical protein